MRDKRVGGGSMANRWAKRGAAFVIFLVSIVLALVVAEAFLRGVIGVDPGQIAEQQRKILGVEREGDVQFTEGRGIGNLILHPYVGFVAQPDNRVNMHGYLGPDPLKLLGATNYNVVITGGSVAGNFCGLAPRIQADLAKLPLLVGKSVNVLCFAVGGFRQPQQLLGVAYFLSLGAKIDLLINLDGFNDIVTPLVHNFNYGTSLFYPIFWRDMTVGVASTDVLRVLGKLEFLSGIRKQIAQFAAAAPLHDTAVGSYVWLAADKVIEHQLSQTRIESGRSQTSRNLSYFQRGYQFGMDESQARRSLVEVWERSSLLMNALAKKGGFSYVHIIQPNQYIPDSKPLTPNEKLIAYKPDQYRLGEHVTKGYPLLSSRADRLRQDGIHFIDATMIFRDVKDDLYIDTCCHFNALGNEILWETVFTYLREKVLRSPS